jgi:hypothetical protein
VAKVKLDYKKLTMEQMMDYIKTYHNDAESKAAFKAVAVKEQKEQKTVVVLDENGNPIIYTDKKGKEQKKKQRVDKPDGKMIKVKDTFAAKNFFFNAYKDEIDFENAPKVKEADNLMDELLSW